MLFSMQLTASGLNGALFHAVLLVVKENKTGHELAPAHLPRVAEMIVWAVTWKQSIVTKERVQVCSLMLNLISLFAIDNYKDIIFTSTTFI